MKIKDFFNEPTCKSIPKLDNGFSRTISDFYTEYIEQTLPTLESISHWDTILRRYIKEQEPILFIRKFGSVSKKRYSLLRRGFLTKYSNDLGYVYCDNYLAQYFYTMAKEGFLPMYEDFKDSIIKRDFPHGTRYTSQEKELMAFKTGKPTRLNEKGWKLAHIIPVNMDYNNFNYKEFSDELLARGERKDWVKEKGIHVRPIQKKLNEEEKGQFFAHFLRVVHPINHFLVPLHKIEEGNYNGSVGELKELIDFIRFKQRERLGYLYESYQQAVIFDNTKLETSHDGDKEINIHFDITRKVTKKKIYEKLIIDGKEYAIGKYVFATITKLINENKINHSTVQHLLDDDFCKMTFKIRYPFLKKLIKGTPFKKQKEIDGYSRYWSEIFTINGEKYLICKEWYPRNQDSYVNWIKKL